MERLIPINEVAERYDKTVPQVRYAITQRRLLGTKLGWCWFFNEDELPEAWPETPRVEKRKGRTDKIE